MLWRCTPICRGPNVAAHDRQRPLSIILQEAERWKGPAEFVGRFARNLPSLSYFISGRNLSKAYSKVRACQQG
jgi:hypothetical protein